MLNFDSRIKVSVKNTRVFGHGGNYDQVHNEVYDWLRIFAEGTQWHERTIRDNSDRMRPVKAKLFYFANKKIAMAFKLAWGGE